MSKAGVKEYHAAVIDTTGHISFHSQDGKFSLKQLQEFVKGYIERVDVRVAGKNYEMFVNEEGLLHGLQYNPKATAQYWVKKGIKHAPHIVGTAVVLSRDHLEGKL